MNAQRLVLILAVGAAMCFSLSPNSFAQTADDLRRKDTAFAAYEAKATTDIPVEPEADGMVGPDDLLDVTVPYCPELTRKYRVAADGSLALPLIKESLNVSGRRSSEIAQRIAERLSSEGYLTNPTVIVTIAEYRSRPVTVAGAVNHPITFQATGRVTLLDALTRAGGISPDAGSTVEVTKRARNHDTTSIVRAIPIVELLSSSSSNANILVDAGDEVRIPEAAKVYVAGNVRRPGAYSLQREGATTVMKAIALSEGVEAFTAKWAYILRAQSPNGGRTEIKVPLSSILARKEPDVAVMPGDILYIPESSGKKMTSRVISQITGFATNAGAGVLIYK